MAGNPEDSIRTFAGGERWKEGSDFVLGKSRVWLSWNAWRDVDDRVRVAEDGKRAASFSRSHEEEDDALTGEGGAPSELHGWGKSVGATGRRSMGSMMFGASHEDLLYASGGLNSSDPIGRFRADSTAEWDKGTLDEGFTPPILVKDGAVEMATSNSKNRYSNLPGGPSASTAQFIPMSDSKGSKLKRKETSGGPPQQAVEMIPTTKTRRWWVRFVWLCTWWVPSFLLTHLGGMKL
jgi:chitin synthase